MPTRRSQPDLLVDTSVAVSLTLADHELHGHSVEALDGQVLGLAGHAAFETFSVMTRLPPPARRAPSVVARLLARNFPETRFLSIEGAEELLSGLSAGEISGGAVYDALVGAAAREHGLALATHDHRAVDTYRALGVEVVLLGSGGRSEGPPSR